MSFKYASNLRRRSVLNIESPGVKLVGHPTGSLAQGLFDESGQKYQYKEFKYNSHYWVLNFLSERPAPLRILDVGTATGYLGAILKEKHHSLVGIEGHGPFAAQARRHYEQFHETDIETFDFPYREEFDYILFADVLEHLRNPEQVLKRALPCLKRDGRIIISVPNIGNIVMRLHILLGRFEYKERGILDKTHLRFFTLTSLKRMVSETGLWAVDIKATPIPIQLVLAASGHRLLSPLHELHFTIVRFWKSMFAYQFVLSASFPAEEYTPMPRDLTRKT